MLSQKFSTNVPIYSQHIAHYSHFEQVKNQCNMIHLSVAMWHNCIIFSKVDIIIAENTSHIMVYDKVAYLFLLIIRYLCTSK